MAASTNARAIDAVLHNLRQSWSDALAPDISVVMRSGASGAWALTDADQLELAILHLAFNARDAMADGGELTVLSPSRSASSGIEEDQAEYLAVQAIDTDVGMTPEIVAQATEPFFITKSPVRAQVSAWPKSIFSAADAIATLRSRARPGGARRRSSERPRPPSAGAFRSLDATFTLTMTKNQYSAS